MSYALNLHVDQYMEIRDNWKNFKYVPGEGVRLVFDPNSEIVRWMHDNSIPVVDLYRGESRNLWTLEFPDEDTATLFSLRWL